MERKKAQILQKPGLACFTQILNFSSSIFLNIFTDLCLQPNRSYLHHESIVLLHAIM